MKKNILRALPLITLIIIIVIGIFSIQKSKNKQVSKNGSTEIINLPDFSFRDLYDQTQTFSKNDLLEKTSLINIFASWCTTCIQEHEVLLKLSASGIINMYGIAWRDMDENTIRYLEKNSNPYLKVGTDNKGKLTKLFSIRGVPETFIINKKGQIIYQIEGNIDEADLEYIEKIAGENI